MGISVAGGSTAHAFFARSRCCVKRRRQLAHRRTPNLLLRLANVSPTLSLPLDFLAEKHMWIHLKFASSLVVGPSAKGPWDPLDHFSQSPQIQTFFFFFFLLDGICYWSNVTQRTISVVSTIRYRNCLSRTAHEPFRTQCCSDLGTMIFTMFSFQYRYNNLHPWDLVESALFLVKGAALH